MAETSSICQSHQSWPDRVKGGFTVLYNHPADNDPGCPFCKLKAELAKAKEENKKIFRKGYEAGLREFAWWKDGVHSMLEPAGLRSNRP